MDTRYISGADVSKILIHLMREHQKFYWAVAWASDNPSSTLLFQLKKKIEKILIGTHFYQTPPEFLRKFQHIDTVRVVPPTGATFHPKVYLFVSSKRSAVVIGSANFTNSAMVANAEACCLIEGPSEAPLFKEILEFISSKCWKKSVVIDEKFLRDYGIQHAAKKDILDALDKYRPLKRPKATAPKDDLIEMGWAEFARKVRSEKHFQMRLAVLAQARILFDKAQSFSKLTGIERKAIAGTLGRKEEGPKSLDWGLFGSMFGFGVLKKKVNENATKISAALDCIPPAGAVTQANYKQFVKLYAQVFVGEKRAGSISSASRLLAMKRPDYFVCIDKANKKGLSAHFGLAASAIKLENYWTDLIEPIQLSPWWRTPRPAGNDDKIWDGRAAFLDALFYKEYHRKIQRERQCRIDCAALQ
jgi:HKD family nuclease